MIESIRKDLNTFGAQCDSIVVINLASTEKLSTVNEILDSLAAFE
jgi:hypothetical protein